MSTVTAERTERPERPERRLPEPLPSRPFGLIRHSLALARRTLLTMRRTPEQFFDVTVQPIIFVVLFVYLFGGAVSGSQHAYLQFVLPALMVQNVLFASMTIGVNLNSDVGKGVFDRFRSLPTARSAPLIGAVLGDVVRYVITIVVLLGFGMIIGFRVHTGPLQVLVACLLLITVALCLCWISVLLGMVLREPGGVQGFSFLVMFPLTFGSNMFVPVDSLPGWLQAWVNVNPVSHLVSAMRGLLVGGPVLAPVGWSLLSAAIVLTLFFPLAVRAYRRRI